MKKARNLLNQITDIGLTSIYLLLIVVAFANKVDFVQVVNFLVHNFMLCLVFLFFIIYIALLMKYIDIVIINNISKISIINYFLLFSLIIIPRKINVFFQYDLMISLLMTIILVSCSVYKKYNLERIVLLSSILFLTIAFFLIGGLKFGKNFLYLLIIGEIALIFILVGHHKSSLKIFILDFSRKKVDLLITRIIQVIFFYFFLVILLVSGMTKLNTEWMPYISVGIIILMVIFLTWDQIIKSIGNQIIIIAYFFFVAISQFIIWLDYAFENQFLSSILIVIAASVAFVLLVVSDDMFILFSENEEKISEKSKMKISKIRLITGNVSLLIAAFASLVSSKRKIEVCIKILRIILQKMPMYSYAKKEIIDFLDPNNTHWVDGQRLYFALFSFLFFIFIAILSLLLLKLEKEIFKRGILSDSK